MEGISARYCPSRRTLRPDLYMKRQIGQDEAQEMTYIQSTEPLLSNAHLRTLYSPREQLLHDGDALVLGVAQGEVHVLCV